MSVGKFTAVLAVANQIKPSSVARESLSLLQPFAFFSVVTNDLGGVATPKEVYETLRIRERHFLSH